MYFNTTKLKGEELSHEKKRIIKQEDIVMAFFEEYPRRQFTPHEVHNACMSQAPVTSTRRAMTCLTDKGKLRKTDEQKTGNWGKKTHTWVLTNN